MIWCGKLNLGFPTTVHIIPQKPDAVIFDHQNCVYKGLQFDPLEKYTKKWYNIQKAGDYVVSKGLLL